MGKGAARIRVGTVRAVFPFPDTSMPRQYTNEANLPDPIVELCKYDDYDKVGDISVTRLISPPRIVQLAKRHESQIVEDVADRIWSAFGSALHVALERSAATNNLTEERMVIPVNGWMVSGKPDLYYIRNGRHTVADYKFTSMLKFQLGEHPEWDSQLNLNAHLFRQHGFQTDAVEIIAFLRDWMGAKAKVDPNYPQKQVKVFSIPLWNNIKAAHYLNERVALHQIAETYADDDLPLCSPEERWYRGEAWAVKKEGNKRADKVFYNPDSAKKFAAYQVEEQKKAKGKPRNILVEHREGVNVRCLSYCPARGFCSFARTLKPELVNENENDQES